MGLKLFSLKFYISEREWHIYLFWSDEFFEKFSRFILASYINLSKREPRAIARFGGIFPFSCFSRSVWSHEPWCQPCKLRYTVVSMSHIISAGTKGQHIRPLWPLLRLGLKIGTFITLRSKCYYRWDLYYTWVQLLHLSLQQRRTCVRVSSRSNPPVSAMFSTLWVPVSTAGEANSKTLILMLLAPLSNKPCICKMKYFLDKSTSSTV